jgi:hypothetical protein
MDDVTVLALCGYEEEAALVMLCDMKEKERTPPFDLRCISEDDCLSQFRFEKDHIYHLKDALRLPEVLKCAQGTVSSGIEGLCIVLRRLAYPNRLIDISKTFGRTQSELSLIFNETLTLIYEHNMEKLSNLEQDWIKPDEFAAAIAGKGSPLQTIWGFIDGTVRPICRPTYDQQSSYNGHKRSHALKFQSVVTPNGMIADLFGPYEGRRHDSALLDASNILERMQTQKFAGFALYGDPAYPLRDNLIVPYRGAQITAEQTIFNKAMSNVREAVEWGFKDVIVQFAFVDFKKNMKLYLQPVGKYYLVAALLVNCRNCLYGNQISTYFEMEPPSLDEYLR